MIFLKDDILVTDRNSFYQQKTKNKQTKPKKKTKTNNEPHDIFQVGGSPSRDLAQGAGNLQYACSFIGIMRNDATKKKKILILI
jgi:hypothetical protein